MAVDLHTHSDQSDGSDSPEELVSLAARGGLTTVALTDHDTLSGIERARSEGERSGIEVIAGIELSCDWQPGTLHMLVLFLEPGVGPLQERLSDLERWREERNRRLVERLGELGIDITMEEVLHEAQGQGVGRPHFAAVLVRKGVVPDTWSAFNEYLAKGKPAYVERPRLQADEAISLARASGAVPVVAHPHTLGVPPPELPDVLDRLCQAGLVGLECHYSDYSPEERLRMAELARSVGLIPSGGSDYHGSYKPWLELGVGRGDLTVPEAVLEELRETCLQG